MIGSAWRGERRRARIAAAVATSLTLVVLAGGGPAVVHAGPLDDVGGGPSASTASTASPIVPTVTCAVRSTSATTYWFGYSSTQIASTVVPVGADNSITTSAGAGPDLAQPDQFRPGSTLRSVAVRVPNGATATWTITFRPVDGITPPSTASATASWTTPACAAGTPLDSANVRVAGASITTSAGPQAYDWTGRLSYALVQFGVQGARTVCSTGGKPLPSVVLWGYADGFGVPGVSGAVAAYAPLPSFAVVRTDTFTLGGNGPSVGGTVSFVRSWSPWRQVVDPQSQTAVPYIGAGGFTERIVSGLSQTVPMADVVGNCLVGRRFVAAPAGLLGGVEGDYRFSITDPVTNIHRPATSCFVTPTQDCDVPKSSVGPGGTRIIR